MKTQTEAFSFIFPHTGEQKKVQIFLLTNFSINFSMKEKYSKEKSCNKWEIKLPSFTHFLKYCLGKRTHDTINKANYICFHRKHHLIRSKSEQYFLLSPHVPIRQNTEKKKFCFANGNIIKIGLRLKKAFEKVTRFSISACVIYFREKSANSVINDCRCLNFA